MPKVAFFDFSKADLTAWAKHLLADISGASTLVDVLTKLVCTQLECDEEVALQIISQRLAWREISRSFTPSLLGVGEAHQVLGRNDYDTIAEQKKTAAREQQEHEVFVKTTPSGG